ncbi:nucleoside hydrolase [Shigella boydii]
MRNLITIVSTGPQTNVALLLNSHPETAHQNCLYRDYGGAMGLGNWTPAAEFNIYVDRKRQKLSSREESRW